MPLLLVLLVLLGTTPFGGELCAHLCQAMVARSETDKKREVS